MNPLAKELVTALREELQQYGEMLARLDEQQASIVAMKGDETLSAAASIEEQSLSMACARSQRNAAARGAAQRLGLPCETPIIEMLSHLPAELRPLIAELVRENNHLIIRVQQRSRQNQMLLARSLETMQRLVDALVPSTAPARYGPTGHTERSAKPQLLYQAVG